MNGRERALRALRRQPVDRIPIYSNFRTPKAIEYLSGMKFEDDPFAATAAAYRRLPIDMTKEMMIPVTEAPPGFRINPTGYGVMRVKHDVDSVEEFIEVVRGFPSFDEQRRDFDFDAEVRSLKEWFDHQQGAAGDTTLVTGRMGGCFDPSYDRFGYMTFMTALVDEPGAVEACIRYFAGIRRLEAEAFVEAGCSEVIWYNDDIAHLGGLLVSPDIMRKIWLPHITWAVTPLFDAGIFVVYHSDGDLRAIMDDIADAGFKGLHPLEPKANMDPVDLKPEWGEKFVLIGGVCQVSVLPFGTEDEVRADVRRLLDGAAPGGGFFIGSTGMCGPDVPSENAIAWIEEAAEYGKKFGTV